MSKNTFDCIDFRTARRLAAHGWTIFSRDTGEGWQWNTAACSARHIRRGMSGQPDEIRACLAWLGKSQPKVLTFKAKKEKWE